MTSVIWTWEDARTFDAELNEWKCNLCAKTEELEHFYSSASPAGSATFYNHIRETHPNQVRMNARLIR